MSESLAAPSVSPVASDKIAAPALFTLGPRGEIESVSSTAETFLGVTAESLVGKPFVSLLVFEVSTGGAPRHDLQWDLLLATALNRTTACSARMSDGRPGEKVVRIEERGGAAQGYFAWIGSPGQYRDASQPVLVDSGLTLLADQGAVGFFDLNFKAGYVYYSAAWKRQLGYNDHELVNTYDSWLRLLHPHDSAAAPDRVTRPQRGGVRNFSADVRMRHRSGHYVWVQFVGAQVFDTNGQLERVSGLQLDISERKDLEDQSIANEVRFQRLSGSGGLAVFDLDLVHSEFWFSPAWVEQVGCPEGVKGLEELLAAFPPGQPITDRLHRFVLAPNAGQESFLEIVPLRNRDGATILALFGAQRQVSRKHELTRLIGFCSPLPPSIEDLAGGPLPPKLARSTFSAISEAVIAADDRGQVLFLNAQAERLTGHALDPSHTVKLQDVFRLVDRQSSQPADTVFDQALASTERPELLDAQALVPADGGPPRPIVWSVRQAWAEDGSVAGLIVIFRDPQEMTLTPEELMKTNRFESLGVIAGGIAHDFNNLLTTILGGISQAKDNRDYSYLGDSERACMTAKALTKQLLSAAKGSAGEAVTTSAVGEILRDALRLARAGANAEVVVQAPDALPSVRGHRSQLLQVFQNLIINALHALPPRRGVVTLRAAEAELAENAVPPLPAGKYVQIEVKDNGCGIAPEHLEKIFEPFFTTKKHGTGLGLPTVKNVVRKHGGQVTVESVVGQGTTFCLFLPAAEAEAEQPEARRAPVLRFGTGRVLLMDDDPDICHLASGMLASLDYKYDVARRGEEAVQLYKRYLNVGRPYDLVILDLTVIGGMGGEETYRELRELDPNVRAIVCSGYDSEEMSRHYLEMGLCGYLTKPFRLGDLSRVIKTVLG